MAVIFFFLTSFVGVKTSRPGQTFQQHLEQCNKSLFFSC